MDIIWKEIPNFPDYKASSNGDIMSFKYSKDGLLLSPTLNKKGYLTLSLYNENGRKRYLVSQVIANTFLGYFPELVIDHVNGIRTDNRIENLEWVTARENYLRGRLHTEKLYLHPKTYIITFPNGQSAKIKNLKNFSRLSGINYTQLLRVVHGITPKTVGLHIKCVEED